MVTLVIILGIVYIGLLAELMMGWHPRQHKKFHRKLFNNRIYYMALLASVLLLIVPVVDLIRIQQLTLPILVTPFIYLLFFKLINWVSLRVNKRNIIIVGKGDNWPGGHKWYVDSLLHVPAVLLSLGIPPFLSLYIDTKLHGGLQLYYFGRLIAE
jgi:hypothetical protein